MNNRSLLAVALVTLLGLSAQASAAEYAITVDMDDTTAGDIDMVETFLYSAGDDSVPSRSLRRITMAGVGELANAANTRFDAYGYLILDDGSAVQFFDEDILKVRRRICSRKGIDGQCGNATIIFNCKIKKGETIHRKCQPSLVQVCPEAGGAISVSVPPSRTKGGVEICQPGQICKTPRFCAIKK